MHSKDPVDLGLVFVIRETDLALLVSFEDTGNELWVPKSVIHDNSEVWRGIDKHGTLVVEAWWAQKEDML